MPVKCDINDNGNITLTKLNTPKVKVEYQIHIALAQWLNSRHILFCHVPNGGCRGQRGSRHGFYLKQMGTKRGMPDLLIFDKPPIEPVIGSPAIGVAIEIKHAGSLSPRATPMAG